MTPEEESEFTRIIDAILATADLQTVTRKKIRQGLEAALGKELTEQKVGIIAWHSLFSFPPRHHLFIIACRCGQIC